MRYTLYVGLAILALAVGCGQNEDDLGPRKFDTGDMVRTMAGGYEGQVVRVFYYSGATNERWKGWFYDVRLGRPKATTGVRLLGPDDDIGFAAMSVVTFRDFELVKIKDK